MWEKVEGFKGKQMSFSSIGSSQSWDNYLEDITMDFGNL